MTKFRNIKDGFIFEAKEGSIHYEILKNNSDYEEVKEEKKPKKKAKE